MELTADQQERLDEVSRELAAHYSLTFDEAKARVSRMQTDIAIAESLLDAREAEKRGDSLGEFNARLRVVGWEIMQALQIECLLRWLSQKLARFSR